MLDVHKSWIHYIERLLIGYVSLIVLGLIILVQPLIEISTQITLLIVGIELVIALILTILIIINRRSEEFLVTDKRVITKEGIFSNSIYEIRKDNIESIDIDQSILGRIFSYGTIEVNGTGSGDDKKIRNINKPIEFRKAMMG